MPTQREHSGALQSQGPSRRVFALCQAAHAIDILEAWAQAPTRSNGCCFKLGWQGGSRCHSIGTRIVGSQRAEEREEAVAKVRGCLARQLCRQNVDAEHHDARPVDTAHALMARSGIVHVKGVVDGRNTGEGLDSSVDVARQVSYG
eukprot:scaffold170200_cov30-Tisochrysis_lutea.AAC.3